ncbi:hypothetical protein M9Y10_012148 [Tritrichomonas musculus]|uniref:Uncharacterized protein n=1 Tax=Tritrichomonas musculus TaxID=1915356 RepID=A0ABR2IBT9_9EUKA
MFGLLCLFIPYCFSADEVVNDGEIPLNPAILSDFITAHQIRNLTMSGKKELAPINGRFFTKPLVTLLQSLQPTVLQFRSMMFQSFDGMVIKGEARGFARFADVMIYDCNFNEGNQHAIHIEGPSQDSESMEEQNGRAAVDD